MDNMQDFERRKLQNVVECIDICTKELQIQVLNNVDAQMVETQSDDAEKKAVQVFIKKPIMNAVNRLQAHKLNLMKLLSDTRPQVVSVSTPTALKEAQNVKPSRTA